MVQKIGIGAMMLFGLHSNAQVSEDWLATLHRPDGENIVFNMKLEKKDGATTIYVINDSEKIKVENTRITNDSIFIGMPVFESFIRAAITGDGWTGTWTKGGTVNEHIMPFTAMLSKNRFSPTNGDEAANITGRWAVSFANDSSAAFPSLAEFKQNGNKLTGTILTPSGDYRYLDGIVTGDQIRLSTFDGGHAFLFTATISNKKTITDGQFYSGLTYKESWHAVKNKKAAVNVDAAAMSMRPGEERLNFTFPDLNGNPVSIHDERFKNKVVIVQIMGSWCPNCMDETAFLSEYYNQNKQRGVEVISLAYEYSTDFDRSVKSLKKFQQRYNVTYPMLITGVSVADSLRTEKTLPQVSAIKFFPSSIIMDKKGKVRKMDTAFVGPGTGKHFEKYSKAFYAFIDELLNEK